jgi:hypothetical protein
VRTSRDRIESAMGGENVDPEDVDNEDLYIDCCDRDRQRIENMRVVRKDIEREIDRDEDDR